VLSGGDVILDFGCWSPEERIALRAVRRWETARHETFEMSEADHDRFLACYQPPTEAERGVDLPDPPDPFATWTAWAADRWPSLPDLGEDCGI